MDLSRQLGIFGKLALFSMKKKWVQDLTIFIAVYAETPRYEMVKMHTAHEPIQEVHMKPTPSKQQQKWKKKTKQKLINNNNEKREKQKNRENVQ